MPLVTTKEMFKKAYDGGYAIGAFNVNNMEIVQGITEAAKEVNAPLILQVSKGARAYANHTYLMKLVEAAILETGLPICLHLDHGDSYELCKSCIDGGFTSVMIDASSKPFAENIEITKQVVAYAHDHGVVVEAELGTLAGVEDEVKVSAEDSSYTHPDEVEEFVTKTGCDSLAIGLQASSGVPDCASRFLQRAPGICADDQRERRQYAGRDRRAGGSAPSCGFSVGVQDQHRLRPAPGHDRHHPQVLCRASRQV